MDKKVIIAIAAVISSAVCMSIISSIILYFYATSDDDSTEAASESGGGGEGGKTGESVPSGPKMHFKQRRSVLNTNERNCLDSGGNDVYLWKGCEGNEWTQWYMDGDRIRHVKSSKCLADNGGAATNAIKLATCNNDDSQKWTNDNEELKNRKTGKCIDGYKGANVRGKDGLSYNLYSNNCNGGEFQKFEKINV